MKPLPYNTGRVSIGSMWTPKRHVYMSEDEARIQRTLLNDASRRRKAKWDVAGWVGFALLAVALLTAAWR